MRLEVIQYGQTLYAKKWEMREAIENATDFEEVAGVKINFAEVSPA